MMRKLFFVLLIIFLFACDHLAAQTYNVVDVIEMQNDLSARTSPRKDTSGKDCALLRVQVPTIKKIKFSGVVGDVKQNPSEYEMYVPEGIETLRYKTPDTENESFIVFADFDVSIKGKSVYKVILKPNVVATPATGSITFTANVDGAVVLIDGKPSGQIPVTVQNIPDGEHTISVPNTNGYTCPDSKVTIREGEHINLTLSLVKTKYKGLGLKVLGYDSESQAIARYKTIEKDGRIGLVDLTGEIVVPCEFDGVYPQDQESFFLVKNNGNVGLYSPSKGLVIDCIYDEIANANVDHSPWFRAKKGNYYGYVDRDGKEIVPFVFTSGNWPATAENSGMIIVSFKDDNGNSLTSVYGPKGEPISAPRRVRQGDFKDGISVGTYETRPYRCFILDTSGKEILLPEGFSIPDQYPYSSIIFNGHLLVVNGPDKKSGAVNKNGEFVIPCEFDMVRLYSGGFAEAAIGDNILYFNNMGKKISTEGFTVKNVSEPGIIISDGNHCGLMDGNSNIRIPVKYDDIFCSENYIWAWRSEDAEADIYNGEYVFLFSVPDYLSVNQYYSRDGIIVIMDTESEGVGFVNEKGEVLSGCFFSLSPPIDDFNEEDWDVDPFLEYAVMTEECISDGMIMLVLGDRFGFMDYSGNVVVPATYTAAFPFKNGVAMVRKQDNTWIRIDKANNVLP